MKAVTVKIYFQSEPWLQDQDYAFSTLMLKVELRSDAPRGILSNERQLNYRSPPYKCFVRNFKG